MSDERVTGADMQDMSGIPLGPGMKVIRLNDPERNQ